MDRENKDKKISAICSYLHDSSTLDKYSTDASVFEVKPQGVAFPKNLEELKSLVQLADSMASDNSPERFSLSPRAGGTCMSGGSLTEGVMVDLTSGFNSLGQIEDGPDPQNGDPIKQIWVGAGTYYRDLERLTLANPSRRGGPLILASYTSSKDICAIGGMVGNNASGEKSLRYGATVDNVLAVKMVCANGQEYEFRELSRFELDAKKKLNSFEGVLYKGLSNLIFSNRRLIESAKPNVKKNAAGYSLWNVWDPVRQTFNIAKLIVGSQGTLGVVTEVLVRLTPTPKYTSMLVLPIENLSDLALAIKEILSYGPEGLETYDDNTYELAKKYMSKEATLASRADGAKLVLFAQFAESTESATKAVAQKCLVALQGVAGHNFKPAIIDSPEEVAAHWAIRRASFKLIKNYAEGNMRAVPVIEDTIVDVAKYGEFLGRLQLILSDYNMKYTFAGHIGDGSIRLVPLVDFAAPDAVDKVFDLARRTYDLVIEFGGSISVDHNDGIIRTPFLNMMFKPEVLAIFAQTKKIFDPHGIFNPGKKVPIDKPPVGSLKYAKEHLSRVNKGLI